LSAATPPSQTGDPSLWAARLNNPYQMPCQFGFRGQTQLNDCEEARDGGRMTVIYAIVLAELMYL